MWLELDAGLLEVGTDTVPCELETIWLEVDASCPEEVDGF